MTALQRIALSLHERRTPICQLVSFLLPDSDVAAAAMVFSLALILHRREYLRRRAVR